MSNADSVVELLPGDIVYGRVASAVASGVDFVKNNLGLDLPVESYWLIVTPSPTKLAGHCSVDGPK